MQQGCWYRLWIMVLTMGIVGLAGAAAASDITAEKTLATLVDDEVSAEAAASVPDPTEARSVPRLSAVDAAAYEAMKVQAQSAPASQAQALAEPSGPAPRISVPISFTGLSQGGFIPPDTIVAKSGTRVLELVNTSIRLTNTVGGAISSTTLNTFFGAAGSALFDPKVYFDRNAVNRRFYAIALQGNSTALSRIWLAVSRSPEPPNLAAGNWCRYFIDGRRNLGTALASWADYPGLGLGADKLVITTNQFTNAGNFTFAIVRVLSKLVAANNAGGCPGLGVFNFQPSGVPASSPFTVQPAQHYSSPSSFVGTSNPVYLLNSIFGTSANYQVRRLRNFPPTLSAPVTIVGGFVNSLQPNAPQDGSAVLLDTGDTRVTQVAGVGNSIAGVHGTGCSFGAGAVSCVRYVRIAVGQNAAGGLTAAFADQSTFGFGAPAGTFIFWPGVALNFFGDAAIDYHRNRNSAGVRFLSSLVTRRAGGVNAPTFAITNGTCGQPFDRTGDYIGNQLDPSDLRSFWLAGERATIIGGSCRWQTQIIKLQLP
jgi:hypothetical protein